MKISPIKMSLSSFLLRSVALIPHDMRGLVQNMPLVGPAQRFFVKRFLSGKSFEFTVDSGPSKGIKYELVLPEDKGIWIGNYEPQFASRLASEVKSGMVGYDIGSWHGYFSGVMLANGASQVVMFEPLPQNRRRLDRLIALNPGYDMTIQSVALGDKNSTAKLIQLGESSMAKLSDSPFQPERSTGDQISVPLKTIDSMVSAGSIPLPDIIKIDVEGAECMVIRGALDTLLAAKPIVLAEVHSKGLLLELTNLLVSVGYSVEVIDASELHREVDACHICAYSKKRI